MQISTLLVPSPTHTNVQIRTLLLFTDIEFRALLEASSPTRINAIQIELAQSRERIAEKPSSTSKEKALARIDNLKWFIELYQCS